MPISVYYLDDEPDLCTNFSELFSSATVQVRTFTDPKELVEVSAVHPPDLFFIDYRLPSTTGDRVAEALDPKIPKYLITGDISPNESSAFLKFISKPYHHEVILEILDASGSR